MNCPTCKGRGWVWAARLDPDDSGKDTCPEPDCSYWAPLLVNYEGGRRA